MINSNEWTWTLWVIAIAILWGIVVWWHNNIICYMAIILGVGLIFKQLTIIPKALWEEYLNWGGYRTVSTWWRLKRWLWPNNYPTHDEGINVWLDKIEGNTNKR